ncbi:Chloramphenicol acetyltransferase [bioreactor metagenome]|uniref:chloramphenicol O-acetyltransferase n=1 Tax=bioreactor metagenome TaxID=1076179 RepID=A0A645DU90_9ZZZZ|nr:type A chloramphenicol O-acetyltransferase [Candidatus Pelethousia sp.]
MKFHRINMDTWHRKTTFQQFSAGTPCTYSITVNLDITKLLLEMKKRNLKIFPTFLYGIATVVNRHSEFRMDFDEHGNVGFYDYASPCYTVFHSETETFTNVWTAYDPEFSSFYHNYEEDMETYQDDIHNSKPVATESLFHVSCIPWASFTGFNLNLEKGYTYLSPILTLGKYFAENGRMLLPLAVQVHHAVCDGFHTARFVNELQEWADTFSLQT